jgi:hypothetical protein
VPTKRRRRAPHHNRFTPYTLWCIANGITGIDLGDVLKLRRDEHMIMVVAPLAEQALAMPRDQLEQFLAAGTRRPFKLRDHHLTALARWCGWAQEADTGKRPSAGARAAGQDRTAPPGRHAVRAF